MSLFLYVAVAVWFVVGLVISHDALTYRRHRQQHPQAARAGIYLLLMILVWIHAGLVLGYLFSIRN